MQDILFQEIYSNIYKSFKKQCIIVFLCGGASTKNKHSLRDRTRSLLESENRIRYGQLPVKVFYPEDLLMDLLNQTHDADLLYYEQFLAINSDIIAIICESAGSLVELGAFTNNPNTCEKVIAAIHKNRKKDKSFIMQGPIRYLKKKKNTDPVYYGTDVNDFAERLIKSIRRKYKTTVHDNQISIDSIFGMGLFIETLLYFYKSLSYANINLIVSETRKKEGRNNEIKELFDASVRMLFNDKYITKISDNGKAAYKLTEKGFNHINAMIRNCTSQRACDRIRLKIMYSDMYKASHS